MIHGSKLQEYRWMNSIITAKASFSWSGARLKDLGESGSSWVIFKFSFPSSPTSPNISTHQHWSVGFLTKAIKISQKKIGRHADIISKELGSNCVFIFMITKESSRFGASGLGPHPIILRVYS